MQICKVASERAHPHDFPAFSAGDCASVPIGSWCASGAHPLIGFGRKLERDVAGRAGHCLRLLGIGLKTNMFKSVTRPSIARCRRWGPSTLCTHRPRKRSQRGSPLSRPDPPPSGLSPIVRVASIPSSPHPPCNVKKLHQ